MANLHGRKHLFFRIWKLRLYACNYRNACAIGRIHFGAVLHYQLGQIVSINAYKVAGMDAAVDPEQLLRINNQILRENLNLNDGIQSHTLNYIYARSPPIVRPSRRSIPGRAHHSNRVEGGGASYSVPCACA